MNVKAAGDRAAMIDVVTVIEFPPGYHPDAARAEVRALFFLAGWREHAAPGFAPCLVCIDAPPPSVRWLAERTGARLVQRPPFAREDGQIFNRARAWDALPDERDRRLVLDPEMLVIGNPAPALGDRRLVLDPEMLVIGNPAPALASLPAGALLAAAPAEKAQVPEAAWPAIYRAVDVPMPTERMQPLRAALGLPVTGKGGDMPPFFHPAAILTPGAGAFSLGEIWARHVTRLAAAWPTLDGLSDEQRASVSTMERVALATAVQALRAVTANGLTLECEPLPRAWDGRRLTLEAGVPLGDLALLHIPGLFSELTSLAQIRIWLEAFTVRWQVALLDAARRQGQLTPKTRLWIWWQTCRMETALRRLFVRHVRPALRAGGEFG